MAKKIFVLCFFFSSTILTFAGTNSTIKSQLLQNPKAEFRAKLQQNENINIPHKKSVAKGVLFSAVVPGAGQFYSGSYLKGILFLGVEAAAITLNIKYNNKGTDFEDEFETLADAEWSEDAYWDWIAQISSINPDDRQALRDYEHE